MEAKLVIPRGWMRVKTGRPVKYRDKSFDPDNMVWARCYGPGETVRDYEFIIRKRSKK